MRALPAVVFGSLLLCLAGGAEAGTLSMSHSTSGSNGSTPKWQTIKGTVFEDDPDGVYAKRGSAELEVDVSDEKLVVVDMLKANRIVPAGTPISIQAVAQDGYHFLTNRPLTVTGPLVKAIHFRAYVRSVSDQVVCLRYLFNKPDYERGICNSYTALYAPTPTAEAAAGRFIGTNAMLSCKRISVKGNSEPYSFYHWEITAVS